MSVDGVVYYRVQNATLAVANITNADAATRLLAQTTLRNVLGTKNLAEILSDREEIAHSMQVQYSTPAHTSSWSCEQYGGTDKLPRIRHYNLKIMFLSKQKQSDPCMYEFKMYRL